MKYSLYSIYDRCSGLYSDPFCSLNDQTANRQFQFQMSRSEMISSDCDLYKLASFDNSLGELTACDKPVFISRYEVQQ